MTDLREELGRELERQFAAVRTHPGWPDPWPDRVVPEEAYSRVTDPARWALGADRAEAWARATVGLGLAAREDDTDATILRPTAAGAVGLRLSWRHVVVEIRLLEGEVAVLEPDCRCDACDSGSADYLAEIDDAMWNVVTGGFVHVDLGHDQWVMSTRHGLRGRGSSSGDMQAYVDAARAGRSRYPFVSGTAWC